MALNPNHTFEDLGEVKCSIAEKNCTPERADFLKKLLEHNGFTVVVVKSPPPKVAAKPAPPKPVATAEGVEPPAAVVVAEEPAPPPPPDTFTVGVTDLTFNPTNAVFNRDLKDFSGAIVTPTYWKQAHAVKSEEGWYW